MSPEGSFRPAGQEARRILFRCDGDGRVGMGHVVRCLALAEELRETHGCRVTFAVASGPPGVRKIRQAGFGVTEKPADMTEAQWMDRVLAGERPHAVVMDFRTDLPREAVRAWKRSGARIVTIDDPTDRRLEADLAFYPPVPQVREMDWTGFRGKLFAGWEWVILRRQFLRAFPPPNNPVPVVLVTMGGSDPKGLTLLAVEALERIREPLHGIVLLGPGFSHRQELDRLLARASRPYEVLEDVSDVAALMARADLAIASFGVTAYELAAVGVPSLLLCLTEDHAASARALHAAGVAQSLGVFSRVSVGEAAAAVLALLSDQERLGRMRRSARGLRIGTGLEAMASRIRGQACAAPLAPAAWTGK